MIFLLDIKKESKQAQNETKFRVPTMCLSRPFTCSPEFYQSVPLEWGITIPQEWITQFLAIQRGRLTVHPGVQDPDFTP